MVELDPRAQEHDIKAHALYAVGRVKALLSGIGNTGLISQPSTSATEEKTLKWFQPAPPFMRLHQTTTESFTEQLDAIATECSARACAPNIALAGRIARMSDCAWWMRNLRRETVKRNETIEHASGHIARKLQCYATDHAIKLKSERARANRATLERLEVVNESGQAFNLQEIADKSISNPKLRRGELMTRARGFEETAELFGHAAFFITITCPSRFNRWSGAGVQNPKWTDETPRDAQDYLCAIWAKIRAAWGRKGYFPYGFRVAEPTHQATPHWHILLFAPPGIVGWFEPTRAVGKGRTCHRQGAGIVGIAGRYALSESPHEAGAMAHRFTCESIDTTRGSATGYIAKYICKNIDGVNEDGDSMGLDFASGTAAPNSAKRVRTWASTWSIRQFQQIGGPSVTVWRELRRLGSVDRNTTPDLFAGPQDAADEGMWATFWMLQGGPSMPRAKLTIKPAYTSDDTGKYGDVVKRIHGVTGSQPDILTVPQFLKTRLHTWAVQCAGLADIDSWQVEVQSAQRVSRFLSAARKFESDFTAPCAAWTGVNNCTDGDQKPVFDFSQFEPETGVIPYLPDYNRTGEPGTQLEEVEIACHELKTTNEQNSCANWRQ